MLLHADVNGRSYAAPSYNDTAEEYAYLLNTPIHHSWEGVERLQAHEALHLFGADDLYNLSGGRVYEPRDIMHYRTRYLNAAQIGPLTAFAIGWVGAPPGAWAPGAPASPSVPADRKLKSPSVG